MSIAAHQERLNRPPDPKARTFDNGELRLPLAQLPEAAKQAAQRSRKSINGRARRNLWTSTPPA
jgi:hypothetical protein